MNNEEELYSLLYAPLVSMITLKATDYETPIDPIVPLKKMIEDQSLNELKVLICLMEWEVYTGFRLGIRDMLCMSINEIVMKALDSERLSGDEYLEHVLKRTEELSGAYKMLKSME